MILRREGLIGRVMEAMNITRAKAEQTVRQVLQVEDVATLDPHEWFLAGRMAWWGNIFIAAVVAENAHAQVFNNSTTLRPSIVVVEGFTFDSAAAVGVRFLLTNTRETEFTNPARYRDGQWAPTQAGQVFPTVEFNGESLAGVATPFYETLGALQTIYMQIVLGPQTGFEAQVGTVNNALRLSAFGYKIDLVARR